MCGSQTRNRGLFAFNAASRSRQKVNKVCILGKKLQHTVPLQRISIFQYSSSSLERKSAFAVVLFVSYSSYGHIWSVWWWVWVYNTKESFVLQPFQFRMLIWESIQLQKDDGREQVSAILYGWSILVTSSAAERMTNHRTRSEETTRTLRYTLLLQALV